MSESLLKACSRHLSRLSLRAALVMPMALLLLGPEGESCGASLAKPCISDRDCVLDMVCIDNRCATPPPSCVCPDLWAPVCGTDGNSYGNACEAGCADVEVLHEGECKADVCAGNDDCDQDLVCYPPTKTCEPQCSIACLVYDPVCGTDGVTYACGEQDAWCHGVEVAHDGECACLCITLYDPVCGVDGKTYSNTCNARCAGVEVASEGACPDPNDNCAAEECGPASLAPNYLCDDGRVGGPGPCVRDEDGRCAWTYVDCPPA